MSLTKIAVVGRIRSGKNTVADAISEKYGHHQFQFGDGIKEVIMNYFPEAIIEGKPRKHYQIIGQSFRELNPNIWIETLNRSLEGFYRSYPSYPVVIPDVRQANEVEYLRSKGFTIIKLEANEEVRIERIIESGDVFKPEMLEHPTEQATDNVHYDYLVSNNGSLDALYRQVVYIMQALQYEYGKGAE